MTFIWILEFQSNQTDWIQRVVNKNSTFLATLQDPQDSGETHETFLAIENLKIKLLLGCCQKELSNHCCESRKSFFWEFCRPKLPGQSYQVKSKNSNSLCRVPWNIYCSTHISQFTKLSGILTLSECFLCLTVTFYYRFSLSTNEISNGSNVFNYRRLSCFTGNLPMVREWKRFGITISMMHQMIHILGK